MQHVLTTAGSQVVELTGVLGGQERAVLWSPEEDFSWLGAVGRKAAPLGVNGGVS